MRDWHFNLVLDAPLTEEQRDIMNGSDRIAEGGLGLAERPGYSRFICVVRADTLTAAIAEALSRIGDVPGAFIRSVELDEIALDENGMATPAVIPAPPRLEEDTPVS
ncbi:hypothetical protein I3J09_17675 [Streptomyces clavuligerus]|uniref:Uncharacterized protein n=3 Tax=Streptomyces clavuligerus TaxID=1901 RepID=E2Q6D3_STRCL|nr:hypothetical protein [Streptomyces clavuligerus]ANW19873.1 hypothetical protein BB341_17430 [Streptomyces clavuligerus]AXU14491.1 hypothetical protein D1794_18200 [Streptomyces clavuligerus]EFG07257.1 Hypothetical protein SCLAV_2184 [Streptomyces clavuligerus]MBY6304503.1 hypothetical protein [Streptomyces clavuligerus]QCS07265.1 hypothetical protein CRV15_17555 [Streptomyces clavuligerus]